MISLAKYNEMKSLTLIGLHVVLFAKSIPIRIYDAPVPPVPVLPDMHPLSTAPVCHSIRYRVSCVIFTIKSAAIEMFAQQIGANARNKTHKLSEFLHTQCN